MFRQFQCLDVHCTPGKVLVNNASECESWNNDVTGLGYVISLMLDVSLGMDLPEYMYDVIRPCVIDGYVTTVSIYN